MSSRRKQLDAMRRIIVVLTISRTIAKHEKVAGKKPPLGKG
jgi:hypothetical protein